MKKILVALLAAGVLTPAFADDDAVIIMKSDRILLAGADHNHSDAWGRWAEDFAADMQSSMGTLFAHRVGSSKVVKGAPYSAEIVTEANQQLADGNVISKKHSSLVYRDGEGRTRQERVREGKDSPVYITDPVAGASIILSPASKKATVTPKAYSYRTAQRDERHFRVGKNDVRIENGKVWLDGKEVPDGKVDLKSASGKTVKIENGKVFIDGKELEAGNTVIIRNVERSETGDGTRREEVRVQVVRAGETREITIVPPVAPMAPIAPIPPSPRAAPHAMPMPAIPPVPPVPPLPGAFTMHFDTNHLGKGVTTSLGMKDFEGVKAEGKSTQWTIPAGQVGNRNPITVTSESWYSPELQVTVYSRYSDPRQGESIYRLANLKRAEPAPGLFKPPEGYDIRGKGKDKLS